MHTKQEFRADNSAACRVQSSQHAPLGEERIHLQFKYVYLDERKDGHTSVIHASPYLGYCTASHRAGITWHGRDRVRASRISCLESLKYVNDRKKAYPFKPSRLQL